MDTDSDHPYRALFEREIRRFQEYARLRATKDPEMRRRSQQRYHRSWPLLISHIDNGVFIEHSAALHDACDHGIGFMCDELHAMDAQLFVRLFWYDSTALRIPAAVRHVTTTPQGNLIGTEFQLHDLQACEMALYSEHLAGGLSPRP